MGSRYLEKPLRPMNEVARELLENRGETYFVVRLYEGAFYFPEANCQTSLDDVVREIAEGQHDSVSSHYGPLAVVRMSIKDNEAEIVTDKIAEAVLDYRLRYDNRGPCPFLDQVMDGWRIRSGLHEEAA